MKRMKGASMHTSTSRTHERGAVSLFVVIFCALLMSVLTISFIRLMVQEQQQAATNDLSQSAYDSAQAGVEDAKRALLLCQRGDVAACSDLDTKTCESVSEALKSSPTTDPDTSNREVKIQTSVGDQALDQAYTCVKVTRKTDDYAASLDKGTSKMIPLKGIGSFDTVELSWFEYDDFASSGSASRDTDLLYATSSDIKLLPTSINAWPKNRPALMRAQLIQYDNTGFTLDSFNNNAADKSNANTLFLYPNKTVASTSRNFVDDVRQAQDGSTSKLNIVKCEDNLDGPRYACNVQLRMPAPINGSDLTRTAYLRLSALYNNSSYSLKLLKGGSLVQFDGVLPEVDSTGRANDLFRRVSSRLEVNPIDFPYPENAVEITGNFCKNFIVTDGTGANNGYASSCTP